MSITLRLGLLIGCVVAGVVGGETRALSAGCKDKLRFAEGEMTLSNAHRATIDRLARVAKAAHRKLGFALSTTVDTPAAIRRSRAQSLAGEIGRLRERGMVAVVSYSADLFFTPDIFVTACGF